MKSVATQSKEVNTSIRENLMAFEGLLSIQDGALMGDNDLCPLKHSFGDGIYVREISIPANTVLTGKIHKHSHPNFLIKGKVEVYTEGAGYEVLEAPMSMISLAGTKRAIKTLEDTTWITCHNVGEERDLKKIEEIVIAPSFKELDKFEEAKQIEGGAITNCGLVALRNLSSLKTVSVKSLLYLAYDNDLLLYPYEVPLDEMDKISYPAIVHSEDHFIYATSEKDLNGFNLTGVVLLTEPSQYRLIPLDELSNIKGATWAAVVVGVVSAGIGIYEMVDAENQKKKLGDRPKEEIPPSAKTALTLEQQMAMQGMPQAQKDEYYKNIQRSNSSALAGIAQRKGGLQGVAAVQQNEVDAYGKVASQDALMRQQNQKALIAGTKEMGEQEYRQWQLNQNQPWLFATGQADAQYGAGIEQIGQGVSSIGSGVAGYYASQGSSTNQDWQTEPDYQNYLKWKTSQNPMTGGSGGGTGVVPSDARLKIDIKNIGVSKSGINIYSFRYKGAPKNLYKGVLAQEVQYASIKNGKYYWVDYSKIDVDFEKIN